MSIKNTYRSYESLRKRENYVYSSINERKKDQPHIFLLTTLCKVLLSFINPVGWGCRIYRLHLSTRIRPFPATSVLDMTQNNLMVRLQLHFWSFGKNLFSPLIIRATCLEGKTPLGHVDQLDIFYLASNPGEPWKPGKYKFNQIQFFDWLGSTVCQPVRSYFMPWGEGIAYIYIFCAIFKAFFNGENVLPVCRKIHWLYPPQKGKTLSSKVGMSPNFTRWRGSSSGDQRSLKHPLHWHYFQVHSDLES